MSLQPGDALAAHNFGLQIDGVTVEYLQEVGGLSLEQDVIEYQQVSANGRPVTKKMPGTKKAGEASVTRGMTQSKAFTDWINWARIVSKLPREISASDTSRNALSAVCWY